MGYRMDIVKFKSKIFHVTRILDGLVVSLLIITLRSIKERQTCRQNGKIKVVDEMGKKILSTIRENFFVDQTGKKIVSTNWEISLIGLN